MDFESIIPLSKRLHVADIGASDLGEKPSYSILMDRRLARLSAFDGDVRQKEKLLEKYGKNFDFYSDIIADGEPKTLHLFPAISGMSSILKPSQKRLSFFTGFSSFTTPEAEIPVETRRLDDIQELEDIDFLTMDIQGSELLVLKNAQNKLRNCVAIQLEASFVPLYEEQPSIGEIDLWMRAHGFIPHCFVSIKPWLISPTTRGGKMNIPFNQLMECDIAYIRDPVEATGLSVDQLINLAYVSSYVYKSPDLTIYLLLELERRGFDSELVSRFLRLES